MESWSEEFEDKLIELWQQNQWLYDISCKTTSDRYEKDLQLKILQKKLTLAVRMPQYSYLSIHIRKL